MTSAVTGLYPWIGFKTSKHVTVWTGAGYEAGGLLLSPSGGAPIETGLSMAMAAAGGRGELIAENNGLGLVQVRRPMGRDAHRRGLRNLGQPRGRHRERPAGGPPATAEQRVGRNAHRMRD